MRELWIGAGFVLFILLVIVWGALCGEGLAEEMVYGYKEIKEEEIKAGKKLNDPLSLLRRLMRTYNK